MAIRRRSFVKLPLQKPDVPIRGGERGQIERVQTLGLSRNLYNFYRSIEAITGCEEGATLRFDSDVKQSSSATWTRFA